MIADLRLGPTLRRFRRLHGIKQGDIAERLGVTQASVSRWESGTHEPEDVVRERIVALIAAVADVAGDAATKRLIASSTLPVHLVCDATHRLLAVSPARTATWQVDVASYIGTSLWRFASPEIVVAEESLADRGWFERPFQKLRFATGPNDHDTITVRPGVMEWETIPLADGRIGRLATTLSPLQLR